MNHDFLPVHLIQTFVAFVEAANITEAAARLGLSQPAVSVHLKRFEESLPLPVFYMHGKRKVLSAYGQALYDHLSPSLHHLQTEVIEVNRLFSRPFTSLRIAGESDCLAQFLLNHTFSVPISTSEFDPKNSLLQLKSGALDLVLLETPAPVEDFLPQLHAQVLSTGPPAICFSRSINFENENPSLIEIIAKLPFLAYGELHPCLSEFIKSINDSDLKIIPTLKFNNWSTLIDLIKRKRGFSLIPHWLVTTATQSPDLMILSQDELTPRHLYAMTLSEHQASIWQKISPALN